MSCPEPLVTIHFARLGIPRCARTTCSRPRLCLKALSEHLFLPPCSLLWSGPAWSQARNSHYCLTRKAASSAEGGPSLRDTLFLLLPVIRWSLSTCLPLHGSLLTWVRGLGCKCGSWRERA